MRADHQINLALWISAFAAGVSLMAFPFLFPDMPRWVLWLVFCGGILTCVFTLIYAIYKSKTEDTELGARRLLVISSIAIALLALVFIRVIWIAYTSGDGGKLPDVTIQFVHPEDPSLVLINKSDKTASLIKYSTTMWNLNRPAPQNQLMIPVGSFEFIRSREIGGPLPIFSGSPASATIGAGDRLAGVISVTCPDCAYTRTYWVYIEWRKGGWISEIPLDRTIDIFRLAHDVPEIAKDPEHYFAVIPVDRRISVSRWP